MRILWLLGYSILCAVLLAVFSQIPNISKFAFSLAAFLVGVHFFRKFTSLGIRVLFIIITLVLYFIILIVYAALNYPV